MKFEHENDYLKILLDTCLQVQANPLILHGLCGNLEVRFSHLCLEWEVKCSLRAIRNILFKEWPKYSKDIEYPVPSDLIGYSPASAFWINMSKWDGTYGDLRKELLQFMIDSLRLALKTK